MTQTRQHNSDGTNDVPVSTLDRTVQKATHALDLSRDAAADASRKALHGIESNPLGILIGGIAVGAAIGALIPRSAREKELLAPVGVRIGTTARAAFDAAKEAGRGELEARGLTRSAARDQVKGLLDGVLKAAGTAGSAATRAATAKN